MCILHNAHKLGKLSLDNCNSLNLPVINSAACIHRYAATSKRRGTEIRLHPYVLARSDSNVYKQWFAIKQTLNLMPVLPYRGVSGTRRSYGYLRIIYRPRCNDTWHCQSQPSDLVRRRHRRFCTSRVLLVCHCGLISWVFHTRWTRRRVPLFQWWHYIPSSAMSPRCRAWKINAPVQTKQ